MRNSKQARYTERLKFRLFYVLSPALQRNSTVPILYIQISQFTRFCHRNTDLRRRLTKFEKGCIMALYNEGVSHREISVYLNRSRFLTQKFPKQPHQLQVSKTKPLIPP